MHARARQCTPVHANARQITPMHTSARQSTPVHANARQSTPMHASASLRQASPSIAKLYLALALKKNQKYCFGELGNTTSMNLKLIYLLFRLFKAIYSYRMCKSLSNTSFKVN
jgi:hypothetical protein